MVTLDMSRLNLNFIVIESVATIATSTRLKSSPLTSQGRRKHAGGQGGGSPLGFYFLRYLINWWGTSRVSYRIF